MVMRMMIMMRRRRRKIYQRRNRLKKQVNKNILLWESFITKCCMVSIIYSEIMFVSRTHLTWLPVSHSHVCQCLHTCTNSCLSVFTCLCVSLYDIMSLCLPTCLHTWLSVTASSPQSLSLHKIFITHGGGCVKNHPFHTTPHTHTHTPILTHTRIHPDIRDISKNSNYIMNGCRSRQLTWKAGWQCIGFYLNEFIDRGIRMTDNSGISQMPTRQGPLSQGRGGWEKKKRRLFFSCPS